MSLLYKDEKDVSFSVEIKQTDDKINLLFSADCGKFGTDEILDEHDLTVKQLLEILQEHEDKQCNIPVVSQQRELFKDFKNYINQVSDYDADRTSLTEHIDKYLKSLNCG